MRSILIQETGLPSSSLPSKPVSHPSWLLQLQPFKHQVVHFIFRHAFLNLEGSLQSKPKDPNLFLLMTQNLPLPRRGKDWKGNHQSMAKNLQRNLPGELENILPVHLLPHTVLMPIQLLLSRWDPPPPLSLFNIHYLLNIHNIFNIHNLLANTYLPWQS